MRTEWRFVIYNVAMHSKMKNNANSRAAITSVTHINCSMAHGAWSDRPLDDLLRESIIMLFVVYLFRHAYIHKSFALSIVLGIALIQHIHGLLLGSDLIPSAWIVSGCWILAALGYWYSDLLVSLAGTYSFVSKFNHDPWLNGWWPIHHTELNKAFVAFFAWILVTVLIEVVRFYCFNRISKTGLFSRYTRVSEPEDEIPL